MRIFRLPLPSPSLPAAKKSSVTAFVCLFRFTLIPSACRGCFSPARRFRSPTEDRPRVVPKFGRLMPKGLRRKSPRPGDAVATSTKFSSKINGLPSITSGVAFDQDGDALDNLFQRHRTRTQPSDFFPQVLGTAVFPNLISPTTQSYGGSEV